MNALFSDSFCASPQDVSDPINSRVFFVVLCLSVRGIQPHAYLSSSKLCTAVHEWQNSIAMHVLTLVLHVYDFILKIRGPVFADHPVDSAATA